MTITVKSDVGRVREINQDIVYVSPSNDFCILADGMGGHNAGNIASLVAVAVVREDLKVEIADSDEKMRHILTGAVEKANDIVHFMSSRDDNYEGMGTTLIVCYIYDNHAYFAHVGDSRVYKIDEGIEQITEDHTIVRMMIEEGTITEEQARTHPSKNVITRAVGTDDSVKVDIFTVPLEEKEKLLICSDGLSDMLSDDEIKKIVDSGGGVDELIDAANEQGGTDNVSAILIV